VTRPCPADGSTGSVTKIVQMPRPLQDRQHAGEDFEPQVVFVAQAVGAALDRPDLVVEPVDETERDLVLRLAVVT